MTNSSLSSIVDDVQKEFARNAYLDLAALQDENETAGHVEAILREKSRALPADSQKRLHDEYFSLGPLEALVGDAEITEIAVNGPCSVWYEKHGRLHQLDDGFLSTLTYQNAVRRLCRQSETQVTLDHPYASGTWRNYRLQVVGPPISSAFAFTLRARPANPWSLQRLIERGWCTDSQGDALERLVVTRSNFLIVGPTGSGKTSVLNACLKRIGPAERAVLMEDTDELDTPNDCSLKLLTRCDPQNLLPSIDLSALLRHALRLRPDRLVLGEVRGPEAKDLLLSLATGHSGSLGTLHASQPQEALLRLEMLVQLGAPQWSQSTVRRLIQLSLHHIVVAQKRPTGERQLEGVYRLSSLEEFGFLVERIA